MSAEAIPNLSNLKKAREGSGLRGLAARRRQNQQENKEISGAGPGDVDRIIQQTDRDASSARASAVISGYLTDPYALTFCTTQPPQRRYPLINRGTYVRAVAIDLLIEAFLRPGTSHSDHADNHGGSKTVKQVISLGAGSDTRFFRFVDRDLIHDGSVLWHELDFAANTTDKIEKITSTGLLKSALQRSIVAAKDKASDHDFSTTITMPDQPDHPPRSTLHSPTLNIHTVDLRSISTSSPIPHSIIPDIPTLILSEMCLTYLPVATSTTVLNAILHKWLAASTPAGMVSYDSIQPSDAFGQTMRQNLASRGIALPGMETLTDITAHETRMRQDLGLSSVGGASVADIYAGRAPLQIPWSTRGEELVVGPEERERIEKIEWVDEVEEWKLLAGHYCVTWGWRD